MSRRRLEVNSKGERVLYESIIVEARERIERLEAEVAQLRAALRDIMQVIETDELIPESVSYMRQARKALEQKQ